MGLSGPLLLFVLFGLVLGNIDKPAVLRFRIWLGGAPESWKSAEAWQEGSPPKETVRTTLAQFFGVDYANVEVGIGRPVHGNLRMLQGLTQPELDGSSNSASGVVLEGNFHCTRDQVYHVLALANEAFRDPKHFQTQLRAYGLYVGIHPQDINALEVRIGALELSNASPPAPPPPVDQDNERYAWFAAEWGPCDKVCHGVQLRQRWCELKDQAASSGSGSIEARVDTRLCLHMPKPPSWQACQLRNDCPGLPGGGTGGDNADDNLGGNTGGSGGPGLPDDSYGVVPAGPQGPQGPGGHPHGNRIFVPWEFFLISPVDRWLEAEGFPWANIIFACVGPTEYKGLPCKGHTSGHLELGRCNARGGKDGVHPLVRIDGSPMGLLTLRDDEAIYTVARLADIHFASAFMLLVKVPSHPGEYQLCMGTLDTGVRLLVAGPRQPTRPEVRPEVSEEGGAVEKSVIPAVKESSPTQLDKSKQQHVGTARMHNDEAHDDWSDEEKRYLFHVLGTGALCGAAAALTVIWCFCRPSKEALIAPAPQNLPSDFWFKEGSELPVDPQLANHLKILRPLGRSKSAPDIPSVQEEDTNVEVRWEMKVLKTNEWKALEAKLGQNAERLYSDWQAGKTGPVHEVCGSKGCGAWGFDFRTMTMSNLSSGGSRALRRRYTSSGAEAVKAAASMPPQHVPQRRRRRKPTWAGRLKGLLKF